MAAMAVDSWPPPRVPVEMKIPASLPKKPPAAHCPPVLSQKACGEKVLACFPPLGLAGCGGRGKVGWVQGRGRCGVSAVNGARRKTTI